MRADTDIKLLTQTVYDDLINSYKLRRNKITHEFSMETDVDISTLSKTGYNYEINNRKRRGHWLSQSKELSS